jgi:heme/copper-type cytochrome/quinol oxidase subunit 1
LKWLNRLNLAQRIVIVVALAAVLDLAGDWITSIGRGPAAFGWVAYAPLSSATSGGGPNFQWRFLVWILLAVVWAVLSVIVFRPKTPE